MIFFMHNCKNLNKVLADTNNNFFDGILFLYYVHKKKEPLGWLFQTQNN